MSQAAKKADISMPAVGDKAPEFKVSADGGETISLSDYRDKKRVVLYFYPKDDTPGCTTEAKEFRDAIDAFNDADTVILGVSKDSVAKHDKFKAKHCLPFPLLSDEESDICEQYGVWVEKNMYGKKYMGIQRATFIIDRNGVISHIWPKVKVDGHVQEVLEAVQTL